MEYEQICRTNKDRQTDKKAWTANTRAGTQSDPSIEASGGLDNDSLTLLGCSSQLPEHWGQLAQWVFTEAVIPHLLLDSQDGGSTGQLVLLLLHQHQGCEAEGGRKRDGCPVGHSRGLCQNRNAFGGIGDLIATDELLTSGGGLTCSLAQKQAHNMEQSSVICHVEHQ